MGLPIKHRKKFVSHKKRWDKTVIVEEKELVKEYALKNKKEIRKVELLLSKYKRIAKSLNRNQELKQSLRAKNFIEKLKKQGFLSLEAVSLDEVLDIQIRNILDRRLSNILYKNKLARTPGQARQFIVHSHVLVNGKCVNSPSYLTSLDEEGLIEFSQNSNLANPEHPERALAKGGMQEVEEMEEIPLKSEDKSFDEKEAELDDEETDEVKE